MPISCFFYIWKHSDSTLKGQKMKYVAFYDRYCNSNTQSLPISLTKKNINVNNVTS